MRILHVINTYAPVTNGVTVSVAGWAAALRRAGHEVAVWTVGPIQPNDGAEEVYRVRGFGRLAPGFPIPASLAPPAPVRRGGWDVVHIHHPEVLGPAAMRFARRIGAACVATAHSDYLGYLCDLSRPVRSAVEPIARQRLARFFGAADAVFAPSRSIERALAAWGVSQAPLPTSYPIDVSALGALSRSDARALLGLSGEQPVAVYAGRLAPDKRVLRLLDEFGETLHARPDARLFLIGDGPQASAVRSRARAFGDAVRVTGPLGAAQLGPYYSAADAFVSASRNEVGPLAAIEAALCGTPTVACAVPGFVDRVVDGETGVLAEDLSGQLGAALARVLADRADAHRMGERARTHLAEHTPEQSARLLVSGYERALEVSTAGSPTARRSTLYETEGT